MSKPPTTNERLARIEETLYNHVLHTLRALDAKLWAVLILLAGSMLALWFR